MIRWRRILSHHRDGPNIFIGYRVRSSHGRDVLLLNVVLLMIVALASAMQGSVKACK